MTIKFAWGLGGSFSACGVTETAARAHVMYEGDLGCAEVT